MHNEDRSAEMKSLALMTENRTQSSDFSKQSDTFAFTGITAAGTTALQPIVNRNLFPWHIGATPGQPISGYLCIRDVYLIIRATGVATIAGLMIYKDTSGVEHYISVYAGNITAATIYVPVANSPHLISEQPLSERERQHVGQLYLNNTIVTIGGGVEITVTAYINFGVYYGFTNY